MSMYKMNSYAFFPIDADEAVQHHQRACPFSFSPWKNLLAAVEVNILQEDQIDSIKRTAIQEPTFKFEAPRSNMYANFSGHNFSSISGVVADSDQENLPLESHKRNTITGMSIPAKRQRNPTAKHRESFESDDFLDLPVARSHRNESKGRRGPRGKSKYKGVCITRAGKWRAVIYIGRKQRYLGVYHSEIEAAEVYNTNAYELFKEEAELNYFEDDDFQQS